MQKFQEEDQALFEAIEEYKNGNGDKATVIYESTKKYTFNILHKAVEKCKSQGVLTGDVISITEDVMQELYIVFFNDIANFRNEDPKSIFKWISVVAHRRFSTYVKENGTEVLQFEKNEDYREESDIWDSSEINDSDMESHHELLPEAALEDKEFRELIMGFVQSLPEAQAQTVLLHFRGGMKYQEIADEMGVSLITVKTRMKKAKDSLEEIINKYEKKTGTKLHSVSILPLLWLLYRMASEDTTVPVAVDTAVTSSVAGASGAGVGSVATAGVTKAIGTKILIGIISTTVVIGGAVVGSQLFDKKDAVAETSQEEVGDRESTEDSDSNNDEPSKVNGDDSVTGDEEKGEENKDTNNQTTQDSVTEESDVDGTNNSSQSTEQPNTSTTPEPEANTDIVKYTLYDDASYERFNNCVSIVKKNGKVAGHAMTTTDTFMNYYDYALTLSNGTENVAWMCMSIGVWSNVEEYSRPEDSVIFRQLTTLVKKCLETIAPQGGTELYNKIDSLILQYGHPCDVPSQGQISESIPGLYVTVVQGAN